MMPTHVTVAIDVDGVVSPLVDPLDPQRHERATGWSFRALPRQMMSRALVAEPIIQTLCELTGNAHGHRDRVTVRWHTSWHLDAPEVLAPALGIPGMTGGSEQLFASDAVWRATTDRWWKLEAVKHWLRDHPVDDDGSHELLVWIDDDIAYSISKGEIGEGLRRDPRLVMISPNTHIGIEPGELALMRSLTRLD